MPKFKELKKMKRILFVGLGPKDSISYNGKLYRNGAAVDMEDKHADAYLSCVMAVPVEDEKEVVAKQKLERKNAASRKRIEEEAKKAGVM